jgi:hypothetical protein
MPDPFIDAQDLVDYLGRGTISDPGMLIALDSACDTCRTIAEQDFNAGTATIALDGNGGDCLVLPHFPVGTVAGTITVNGEDETEFMVTDNGMLLRGTAGVSPRPTWPEGRQNVTITYQHGYAAADLPRDVRMVALSVASRYVVQGVAKRESLGDLGIDYATAAGDLTANELRILRKYRRTRSF